MMRNQTDLLHIEELNDLPFFRDYEQTSTGLSIGNSSKTRHSHRTW